MKAAPHGHNTKNALMATSRKGLARVHHQVGKIGYILLWLLGVPIPVLFLFYLLRGCT